MKKSFENFMLQFMADYLDNVDRIKKRDVASVFEFITNDSAELSTFKCTILELVGDQNSICKELYDSYCHENWAILIQVAVNSRYNIKTKHALSFNSYIMDSLFHCDCCCVASAPSSM